ncbi:MAG TPA: hypothetical protein VIS07_08555 [Candidatus Binatia bacterium]
MQTIARVLVLLALTLAAACGDGDKNKSQPTPTPVATPRPTPGCGNGIVDPGEFCDGQDFCVDCQVELNGCCEFSDGSGGSICATQSLSPQACVTVGGGRFSVGRTCRGSDCSDGTCFGDGRCVSDPITPVSICCQVTDNTCYDAIVSTTDELGKFIDDCAIPHPGAYPRIGQCSPVGECFHETAG